MSSILVRVGQGARLKERRELEEGRTREKERRVRESREC